MIHLLISKLSSLVSSGKLSILIYHQVFEQKDELRSSEPDAKEFHWQMELIRKYMTPLSLSEAIAHIKADTLPRNAVCISFDDGYINNLTIAAPILKSLSIPATVFISTSFIEGKNMWNDRLIDLIAEVSGEMKLSALDLKPVHLDTTEKKVQLIGELIGSIKYRDKEERSQIIDALYDENGVQERPRKMMDEMQIKQLHSYNIDVGAHTVDHPILKSHDEAEQKRQIVQSKVTLEGILGQEVIGFAYPNGKLGVDYDETSKSLVASSGFQYAVSTDWGFSTKETNPYKLLRFTPWDKKPLKFHFRLVLNLLKS